MVECNAVRDGRPVLLGCRLPMETSYRDFWELPYPEGIRFRLMATFLQAKAGPGVAEGVVGIRHPFGGDRSSSPTRGRNPPPQHRRKRP